LQLIALAGRREAAIRRLPPLALHLGSLRRGEKLLVRISGRALQGRVGFVGPNALKVGLTPRRLRLLSGGKHSARKLKRAQILRAADGGASKLTRTLFSAPMSSRRQIGRLGGDAMAKAAAPSLQLSLPMSWRWRWGWR
jgi:hypothetical protein